MIRKLISVCSAKDAATFAVSSHYISRFIKADKYVVLVPQADLGIFLTLDLGAFAVISEEKYAHIRDSLLKRNLGHRTGWYFQQFIKMAELDDGDPESVNLIWDADTVPLGNLDFFSNTRLFFHQGKEYHLPYFSLIKSLTGLGKQVPTSFIAQCLPYRVRWFRSFKTSLEANGRQTWFDRIIDLIDPTVGSGFSEYETLGTYAAAHFRAEMQIASRTNDWYRYGTSLIGSVGDLPEFEDRLKARYKYISFETWDKSGFAALRRSWLLRRGLR